MITGELRNKIDSVWNAFWAGGIANPHEVIEQITYLLFMRGLDDIQTREERKANRFGKPMERVIFPNGNDPRGRPYSDLRWPVFKGFAPARPASLWSAK
ncbi:type I restriction-modification system subunit M N-terminal domain-containing protein [Roseibium sediminicola]|uniref:type I restriction-modification system subunit M N-terminal domain-containing protein n=1 Tax=Roseibium sediminicola TaxID=2933272 RepID=UPI0031F31F05